MLFLITIANLAAIAVGLTAVRKYQLNAYIKLNKANYFHRIAADCIHICKANDPALSKCMVQSVENMRSYLAVGIPEMDVPSIEPTDIGDLIVSQRTRARSGLHLSANNIKIYNSSQYNVQNMK